MPQKNSFYFFISLAVSSALATAVILGIIMLLTWGGYPPTFYIYAIFVNILLILWNHEVNNSRRP